MKLRSSLPDCPWYLSLPCALAGLVLSALTVFYAQTLDLGTAKAKAAVGILLFLLIALSLCLLRFEGCPRMSRFLLLLPTAAAIYLRLVCLDHQTHDYQTFLANWAAFFRENGGFSALKYPVGNYNVPYLYFLAAISYLPMPDLYLIKLFSILLDVLLAWAGLRVTRQFCRENSPAPLICFTLMLLLPTVILNGACWAQCDSLYASLTLLAFSAALEQRPKTSVLLLAIAFSFKLQTVFLIPLWCIFWYIKQVKFRHLFLFPIGYLITVLPALALGKPFADIMGIYFGQAGEYSDYLTLNAPSIFSFLPYGASVNTSLASALGIAAAFLLVLFLLGLLFWKRKQITPHLLLTAAAVLSIGVPFFLPNMHERYFLLADVVTLAWACSDRRRIPIALLVEASSLSCYSTYLNLRYTLPIHLGGQYYVMIFEALLMFTALLWSLAVLVTHLKPPTR